MEKRDFEESLFFAVIIRIIAMLAVIALILADIGLCLCVINTAKAETYTCVVHKGEWVWIRESPSPSARQIGRVRFGYEIESDEPENGYFAIYPKQGWMLDGEIVKTGYVDASYFDRAIPETMYRVNTQGGALAKRETPNGRLICWIKPGVKISVLGWRYAKDGELWAKVYKGGYVKAEFLTEL